MLCCKYKARLTSHALGRERQHLPLTQTHTGAPWLEYVSVLSLLGSLGWGYCRISAWNKSGQIADGVCVFFLKWIHCGPAGWTIHWLNLVLTEYQWKLEDPLCSTSLYFNTAKPLPPPSKLYTLLIFNGNKRNRFVLDLLVLLIIHEART